MNPKNGYPAKRDEELIHLVRQGGDAAEPAIAALYLKYRRRMMIFIHELLHDHPACRSSAQDLLHDSYLLMLHKIEVNDIRYSSLISFWRGVCRHLLRNQVKRDDKIILVDEPDEAYYIGYDTPETRIFDQEEHAAFEHSFDCLGERCKEVLLLWINRYSMHEIAERMGLSSDAMARKIKHDCFKKLKNLVLNGNKLTSRDT